MPRILLVEDNEMNRDMLSRRLERHGFEVLCAEDGGTGVRMVRESTTDLLLLDMSLPIMDGWTVARMLREDPATASVKIIALTAHAMAGDREKVLAAGCDEYDTKPVDFKRLMSKIERFIPSS